MELRLGTVGRWALAIALFSGLAACGGDDDDDTANNFAGTGGTTGAAGSAGSMASAGSGGMSAGGSGGAGGLMLPMQQPVMCGTVLCEPHMGSIYAPCCVPGTNECGGGFMGSSCSVWDAPGDLDPTCPDSTGMTVLKGCCTPDNACGVKSMMGLGCIERTKVSQIAGGPLDAIQCGTLMPGADGGMPMGDGGTPDAGNTETDSGTDAGADSGI